MNAERPEEGANRRVWQRQEGVSARDLGLNEAPSLLELASAFTRLRRRVFPVGLTQRSDGSWDKRPLINEYHGDRPYPLDRLHRMPWDRATHLGMSLFPGEVVLDFDVKDGKQARSHLDTLAAAYGALQPTVGQTTMSGGWHWFYLAELGRAMPARVALPDGRPADIDVIHAGHRFLVLYEPETLLRDWTSFAELPPSWAPALTKRSHQRVATVSRPLGADRWPIDADTDIAALIDQVRACEDERNETLNRNVFVAVKTGLCTESDLDAFRDAAVHAGLPLDEVERTLESATSGALELWGDASDWYLRVADQLERSGRRNRSTLMDAAAVIVCTSVWVGKSEVGMSVRDLSRELGVSHKTAAGLLGQLVASGWLRRRYDETNKGMRYSTVLPPDAKGDSRSLVLEGRLSPFDSTQLARMKLRKASAFQRLGKGPVLPPSALAVVSALQGGSVPRADLPGVIGYSASSVSRALKILSSAGLIDVVDGHVTLLDADTSSAVEHWAQLMGVDGRPELRDLVHAFERQRYAEHLTQSSAAVAKVMDARDGRGGGQARADARAS